MIKAITAFFHSVTWLQMFLFVLTGAVALSCLLIARLATMRLYERAAQRYEPACSPQRLAQFQQEQNRLQRELQCRSQAFDEMLFRQECLTAVLDALDWNVLVLNDNEDITFINHCAARLLGYSQEQLLGRPFATIAGSDSALSPQKVLQESRTPGNNESLPAPSREFRFNTAHGSPTAVTLLQTERLEVEDQSRFLIIFRPVSQDTMAEETISTVAMLKELDNIRVPLKNLEYALLSMQSTLLRPFLATLLAELGKIEQTLERLGSVAAISQHDTREQLVSVMKLCIAYWEEATGFTKFDLANQSSLWTVYTNPDGWQRTQTLDKYLDLGTLPKKPHLDKVAATAKFVLSNCESYSTLRSHLEKEYTALTLTGV